MAELPVLDEAARGVDLSAQLTPKEIVRLLDNYIVGQNKAKRAVAIALRNRWRRLRLDAGMREEVAPKNILMIGPTGVGKTEIARRLAKLSNSPFIKVEASKYTEVGYVGRDVESMVRDLVELTRNMVREEQELLVREKAAHMAEERLLDLLVPPPTGRAAGAGQESDSGAHYAQTREKFRGYLREGRLNDRMIEMDVQEQPALPVIEVVTGGNVGEMGGNLKDMLGSLLPKKKKRKSFKVPEALRFLEGEEAAKLVDQEKVTRLALERAQQSGIVFIDEIDKIAGRQGVQGPDVSREGVQRDLLPIVEGSSVNTRYGIVKTDHILFIAAGAFHSAKPSDLIPEFQGRFPIRVELEPLTKEDFVRILREPDNALIKQCRALLATEGVDLVFTNDAVEEIARMSESVNQRTENIGARRLQTITEKVLEDVSFDGPALRGQMVTVNAAFVRDKLKDIIQNEDLSRYIL